MYIPDTEYWDLSPYYDLSLIYSENDEDSLQFRKYLEKTLELFERKFPYIPLNSNQHDICINSLANLYSISYNQSALALLKKIVGTDNNFLPPIDNNLSEDQIVDLIGLIRFIYMIRTNQSPPHQYSSDLFIDENKNNFLNAIENKTIRREWYLFITCAELAIYDRVKSFDEYRDKTEGVINVLFEHELFTPRDASRLLDICNIVNSIANNYSQKHTALDFCVSLREKNYEQMFEDSSDESRLQMLLINNELNLRTDIYPYRIDESKEFTDEIIEIWNNCNYEEINIFEQTGFIVNLLNSHNILFWNLIVNAEYEKAAGYISEYSRFINGSNLPNDIITIETERLKLKQKFLAALTSESPEDAETEIRDIFDNMQIIKTQLDTETFTRINEMKSYTYFKHFLESSVSEGIFMTTILTGNYKLAKDLSANISDLNPNLKQLIYLLNTEGINRSELENFITRNMVEYCRMWDYFLKKRGLDAEIINEVLAL